MTSKADQYSPVPQANDIDQPRAVGHTSHSDYYHYHRLHLLAAFMLGGTAFMATLYLLTCSGILSVQSVMWLTTFVAPSSSLSSPAGAADVSLCLQRPQCRADLYADGEWRYERNRMYPYFHSIPHYSHCDDEPSYAHWSLAPFDVVRNLNRLVNHSLLNSSAAYVRPAIKYRWTPHTNDLVYRDFPLGDARHFCTMLNQRPLLFIGDSLTHELALSTYQQLGAQLTPTKVLFAHVSDPYLCHRTLGLPKSAGRPMGPVIEFHRSDNLHAPSRVPVSTEGYDKIDPLYGALNDDQWMDYLQEDTILVINRGAHWQPDAVVRRELNDTLTYLFAHFSRLTVILWSSVSGHAHPDDHSGARPLTRQEFDAMSSDEVHHLPAGKPPQWGWPRVYRQNAVARQVLLEAAAVSPHRHTQNAVFMNVNGTSLRLDGHRDYIHYCLPGPPDDWSRMLYNILADLQL